MNPDHEVRNQRSGYLFAAVTVCLWAGFVWLSRIAGSSGLNGFDMTALRFGVATIVLLPMWLFWRRVPLFNREMLQLAGTGGIGYALLAYSAFQFAPAAHGAVLISGILPFFVTVLAWRMLGERPGKRRYIALSVIAAGVGSLAMHSLNGLRDSWPGDLMMIGGSFTWGLYTVLVKKTGKQPWDITIGVALLSAIIYLPVYGLVLPKGLLEAPWHVILVQGVFHGILVVIVAMVCFMKAMGQLGPVRMGAVMATVPSIAGMGAVILLGESFSFWLLAGLICTSVGAWLGARSS